MKKIIPLFVAVLFLTSCGGDKNLPNPLDQYIKDLDEYQNYTVILNDMEEISGTFSNDYKHQYKVIIEKDSIPKVKSTAWHEVSKAHYNAHRNNMGMEVLARVDGKINKTATPPGYNRYVGHSRYGYWGGGFWHWYGSYFFMSRMFGGYRHSRMSYNTYNRNYRGTSNVYRGGNSYGTNSSTNRMRSGTRYSSGGGFRSSSGGGGFGK